MTAFELYLMEVLPSISTAISIISGISLIVCLAVLGCMFFGGWAFNQDAIDRKREELKDLKGRDDIHEKHIIKRIESELEGQKASLRICRYSIFSAFLCFALLIGANLIPTREGFYRIAGGYILTNVENIEQLPANMVDAANAFLKEVAKSYEGEEE